MPSPLTLAPAPSAQPTITTRGGETVQELDQALRKNLAGYRNAFVGLAHYSYKLWAADDWAALGFTDEEAYRESLGLSDHAWRGYLLLGERLADLSLEQMRELTAASAKLLAKVPEKLWGEFAWVEEARMLPSGDFAALVGTRTKSNKKLGLSEPRTAIALSVPAAQRTEFERRIESLRRAHRLSTPADVLDFALRAAERDPAITTGVWKIEQTVTELARVWKEFAEVEQEQHADAGADASEAPSLTEISQQLTNKITKILKELRRHAHGLQAKEPQVAAAEPVAGDPSPR